MKRITMLFVVALAIGALSFTANYANAQNSPKFAYINSQELIALMPERDSALVKLQKFQKELAETAQSMQTDFQTKLKEYQDKRDTWAPAVTEAKTKELNDLQQRIEQYYQQAEQDFAQRQETLMTPVIQKAQDAINKVAKAQGITYLMEAGSMVYVDQSNALNLLAAVKSELGIPASKTQPMQF